MTLTYWQKPKVIDVHKVVQFLRFTTRNIPEVYYCPNCCMCNITGSSWTNTVTCQTCNEWYQNPELQLDTMAPKDYITLISRQPLFNNGRLFLNSQEAYLERQKKPRTYDDLTNDELDNLDILVRRNS